MGHETIYGPPCLPQECEPDPVEYLVFRLDLDDPTDIANSLNSMGKKGWILCHADDSWAIFYRPTKGRERWNFLAQMQAKKVKSLISLQARTTKATGRSRQVFKRKRKRGSNS